MTKYTALDIAKYILNKCYVDENYISNLQLQKILYFLQVEYLRKYSEPLFKDNFLAWHYGPVVAEVYYEYCRYGSLKILERSEDVILDSKLDTAMIDNIIENRREISPWELVEESHLEGGSWSYIYNKLGFGGEITTELIRELDL